MSDHPKLDRRVQRTRQALRDALIALIQEKDYEQIQVQEIAERANVNRVTFYLHYKDKDDLLLRSMRDVHDDLVARMKLDSFESATDPVQERLTFEHVKKYAGFYKVMFSAHGVAAFQAQVLDYVADLFSTWAKTYLPPQAKPPLPVEVSQHFLAGAFIGLLRWWVLNDLPYSVDEMVRMWTELERHSCYWALGLDQEILSLSVPKI